jgi:predicted dehydrogenase
VIDIQRRTFLKVLSAAGLANSGTLTTGGTESLAVEKKHALASPFRRLDPEGELRVGMVGTSGHTNLVLDAIPEIKGARLAAYALRDGERFLNEQARPQPSDISRKEAEQVQRHPTFRPDTRIYGTYQEMFSKEELDVVGTCLPYAINAFASIAAAEMGIHVMSEKPLATELSDLEHLEHVVRQTGIQISAMLDMRLSAGILTVRDAISKGLIGDPVLATAQKSYKFGERPWFYKKRETYGGTIPWIGIHAIDFIQYTTRLKISQVAAMQSNQCHPDYPGAEDNVGILLKFSNGGTAVVTLDYLRPEAAEGHGDDRLRVIGDQGVVEMRGGKVELTTRNQPARELPLLPSRSIFADFVAYLRGQGEHVIAPGEAIAVTRVCLLTRQAADEQRLLSV